MQDVISTGELIPGLWELLDGGGGDGGDSARGDGDGAAGGGGGLVASVLGPAGGDGGVSADALYDAVVKPATAKASKFALAKLEQLTTPSKPSGGADGGDAAADGAADARTPVPAAARDALQKLSEGEISVGGAFIASLDSLDDDAVVEKVEAWRRPPVPPRLFSSFSHPLAWGIGPPPKIPPKISPDCSSRCATTEGGRHTHHSPLAT